ncbi:hypothetical protein [Litoreibacter arenae]|uniref:Uncharacterized protein n=1 Tax=Litoreibacter arenae DSM 19593 TaxID=1123360 RepID=S9QBD8_9RHOB|nr:hypothetical protein [Litoreibacter arenae]EPX76948.1 hypothetical protein thalar_02667 [Litoreibacter arenae DSM 19593]
MKQFLAVTIFAAFALPATAQEVRPCDELARVDAVAEPWADSTQTFAGNRVRLVVIDTLEPAAAAFHLVILSPPFDEVGGRQCMMVGSGNSLGFGGMTLVGMTSSYDPATGLTWGVPVKSYNANTGGFDDRVLKVTLNQSSGAVTAGF